MHFSSLFVLSSLILSGVALPAISAVYMLDDVRHKLDSITAKINAFPSRGGTFEEAIEIHRSGVLLRVDMGEYTRDLYRFHTFDKAESQDNMKAAKRLERSSEKSLEAIVAKKHAFKNVHANHDVLAIITQDVEAAASASDSFNRALTDRTYVCTIHEP
ncbi:hypothetical protein C0989_004418 [Termitomyces sp. Mn162]|nr:hypothetical protein C0989_004418 [Termitomyces sp. Mn162]